LEYIGRIDDADLNQTSGTASSARNKRNKENANSVAEVKEEYERRRAEKEANLGRMWEKMHEPTGAREGAESQHLNWKRIIGLMSSTILSRALSPWQVVCPTRSRTTRSSSNTEYTARTVPLDVAHQTRAMDDG
jgi:hypothetical protein